MYNSIDIKKALLVQNRPIIFQFKYIKIVQNKVFCVPV